MLQILKREREFSGSCKLMTSVSQYACDTMVIRCYGRYKTPQVLLNRVPEQATEDRVKYQIYY